MEASEMPRRETPERGDGADAPVGKVGGRSPSTLSIGGDASAAVPFSPGQRWSMTRKCATINTEIRFIASIARLSGEFADGLIENGVNATSGTKCISLRCSTSGEFNNSFNQTIG